MFPFIRVLILASQTIMEIIPYKREASKRTSTSTSAGKKRRNEPGVGSTLKSGKGKKRRARGEDEAVDDSGGIPPKKRAKFDYDSSSGNEATITKLKRKRSNKEPNQLKNEALPRLPLGDGFRSAKDIMDTLTNEGMSSSEPESLSQIRNSTKYRRNGSSPLLETEGVVANLPSMTKGDTKTTLINQKLTPKPTTNGPLPQASEKSGGLSAPVQKNTLRRPTASSYPTATGRPAEDRCMKWLMDSDSDLEPLETNTKPSKVMIKLSNKSGPASPPPIIDLDDEEDGDGVHLVGEAQFAVRRPAPESPTSVLLCSSPAPPPRVANPTPDDSNPSISPPVMRRLKRKMDTNEAARSMPPPPRPSKLATETPPVGSPVVSRRKNSEHIHSLLNGHEFLEVEAEHSGDDIEAGSSDPEGVENESDRKFAGDFDMSQVADDYDQPNVYRQSLFTQAPTNGPSFLNRPLRIGAFAGGRAWQRQGRIPHGSSSPPRNEEPDEYSFGSFVVHDDQELLYDTSSSPIQAENDTL